MRLYVQIWKVWCIWMYFAPWMTPVIIVWTILESTNFVYIWSPKFVDLTFWPQLYNYNVSRNDYRYCGIIKHTWKSSLKNYRSFIWRIFISAVEYVKILIFVNMDTLTLVIKKATGQHLLTWKFFSSYSPESGDYFEYLEWPHISNILWDTVNFINIVD